MPKGKPVWLLIDSKPDAGLAKEFEGRVRSIRLDPDSQGAEDAMTEFSILKPPASVLADSKGRVVEKIEGRVGAAEMRKKLERLVGKHAE